MRSNIGSVSKQFTAFAISLLAERGKLSLDDPVRKHIPELPAFDNTVTLRHLLTHTSGYRDFYSILSMAGRSVMKGDYIGHEELIEVIQRQPKLQNEPGAEFSYNNTGYGLLATVVERVADQPFRSWMKQNVFEPLGMSHTVVRANPFQIVTNSAQGYAPAEDGGYRNAPDLSAAMGAGAIYTTVRDLAEWIENLETAELGGKDVIRQMTTPYVLASGDTTNVGFGVVLDEHRGLQRIAHSGGDIAHRARLMYYPEIDAGIVTMSNNRTFAPAKISAKIAEAFLHENMKVEKTSAEIEKGDEPDPEHYNTEAFDALTGRYEFGKSLGNAVLTITRKNQSFFAQMTGQPKLKITPASDSTFKLHSVPGSITFHGNKTGTADSLTLHQSGTYLAHRLEEAAWEPSEEDLATYTGRYFSKELQTYYTLTAKGGQLLVQHRRLGKINLKPTQNDTFSGEFPVSEVTFTRNEEGTITGFAVANGRAQGVRFKKQR
jgi:CubicO group peptidase (beta-lactamase class C family)